MCIISSFYHAYVHISNYILHISIRTLFIHPNRLWWVINVAFMISKLLLLISLIFLPWQCFLYNKIETSQQQRNPFRLRPSCTTLHGNFLIPHSIFLKLSSLSPYFTVGGAAHFLLNYLRQNLQLLFIVLVCLTFQRERKPIYRLFLDVRLTTFYSRYLVMHLMSLSTVGWGKSYELM